MENLIQQISGLGSIFQENPWLSALLLLWVLPWKGVALWKAAHKNHKPWFIALLIVNTLAILEILYIFVFSKLAGKKETEAKKLGV